MTTQQARYLTAQEAADELAISLATLYAYVSRGLIRSEATGSNKRTRRYLREDVQKLKQRKEARRNPAQMVESALHWGTPILESALTLISDGRFYYRGYDALNLAATCTVEQVAALIWTGELAAETPPLFATASSAWLWPQYQAILPEKLAGLTPVEAFQVLLPLVAADDVAAYDLRPSAVAQTGARLLGLLAAVAVGGRPAPAGIAAMLQQGWVPHRPQAVDLINAALILCADHELNVSSFTARCVASAGATPYAVVMAGLAALQGVKHGGYTERVEALFREVGQPEQVRLVLRHRLRRGESMPGFGHRLYPNGDPRGRALLTMTAAACPDSPAVALATTVVEEIFELIGEHPTLDFGLVTLARALDLPAGGALALFALGRTIGWLGHAIEQYQTDQLIRPRARYVGQQPAQLA